MRSQTQWAHGFAGPTGLKYEGVAFVATMGLGVEFTPELFAAIQTCEYEYLDIVAKRQERERMKRK